MLEKFGSRFNVCPMCDAGTKPQRHKPTTEEVWCSKCGTEWEPTGEGKNMDKKWEVLSCPPDPERVGNVRPLSEWTQMTNAIYTSGNSDAESVDDPDAEDFDLSELPGEGDPTGLAGGLGVVGVGAILCLTIIGAPLGILLIIYGYLKAGKGATEIPFR